MPDLPLNRPDATPFQKRKQLYSAALARGGFIPLLAGLALVLTGAGGGSAGAQHSGNGSPVNRSGGGMAQRLDIATTDFVAAFKAQQAGRTKDAISDYEAGLKLRPDFLPGRFNLSVLYLRVGQTAKAITQLQAIEASKAAAPPHLRATAQLRLGVLYEEAGKHAEAKREFEAVMKAEPDNIDAIANLASMASRSGDTKSALVYLKRYAQLSPHDALAHFNLAVMYGRVGQTVNALHEFQASVALPENLPAAQRKAALANIGLIYDHLSGHTAQAVQAYQRLVKYDGTNPAAWMALAIDEEKVGQSDAALNAYGEAIRLKPDSIPALFNRGVILLRQKRYPEASTSFAAVLKIDPHNAGALSNLAFSYLSTRSNAALIPKARALYEQAEKLDPKNPGNYAGLAYIDEVTGDNSGAAAQYEALIKLKPADPEAMNRLVAVYARAKNWKDAIRVAKQAAALNPHDAAGWIALANIQIQANQDPDAIVTLKHYLTLQPDSAPALIKLASVLSESPSSAAEARKDYEAALKADPNNLAALQGISLLLQRTSPADAIPYVEKVMKQSSGPSWFFAGTQLISLYQQVHPPRDPAPVYQEMIHTAEAASTTTPEGQSVRGYLPYLVESLATLYKKQGTAHYAEAAQVYDEALKSLPDSTPLLLGSAQLDELQNQPAAALERYTHVVDLQPDNGTALAAFMRLNGKLHGQEAEQKTVQAFLEDHLKSPDAERIFDAVRAAGTTAPWLTDLYTQIAAAHPENKAASIALANAYSAQYKWADALKIYQRLASADPNDARLQEWQGQTEERLGQHDAALADFRAAAKMAPQNLQFQAALLRMLEQKPGNEAEETQILRTILTIDPADSTDAFHLSRLFTGPDAVQKRIALYRDLLKKPLEGSIAGLYHDQLGDALKASGDLEGARREYEAALTQNPQDIGAKTALVRLNMAPKPVVKDSPAPTPKNIPAAKSGTEPGPKK